MVLAGKVPRTGLGEETAVSDIYRLSIKYSLLILCTQSITLSFSALLFKVGSVKTYDSYSEINWSYTTI